MSGSEDGASSRKPPKRRRPRPGIGEEPGTYKVPEPPEGGDLADRIAYLAECIGRPQLADAANVSEPQIFRYIARQNEPRTSVMVRLAEGAGVNADWLLTGSGPVFPGEKRYAPEIDGELLTRILTGVEELTDARGGHMDAARRAEFAVSVYRHAMQVIPDDAQRREMVGGFIDVLHPLFGKRKNE